MSATLAIYDAIVADRPVKLSAEEVEYSPAPEGSAMRCGVCWHYYRRATDGHAVCEIFRSPEVDRDGVDPAYKCKFHTVDGDVFPYLEESP